MEENINLVYYILNKYFKRYQYLKDDLISEGFLALCRAEKYFDESKGIKKSTYLSKAIYMAMYKYLKKEQKHNNNVSLYAPIRGAENLDLIDQIPGPDLIDDFLTNEVVSQIIKTETTDKEKQILDLYSQGYTQKQIAKKMETYQTQISRTMKRIKKKCAKEMGGD